LLAYARTNRIDSGGDGVASEAAIPPEEDAVSIDAAFALRETFAKESPAVRALFDALVKLLAGGERTH
jgi:hypothetical protein